MATMSQLLLWACLSWMFLYCLAQGDLCKMNGSELFLTVLDGTMVGEEVTTIIVSGNNSEIILTATTNPFFTFEPVTRKIKVSTTVDAETSLSTQNMIITCRVRNTTRETSISVKLFIKDVNDHGPVFTSSIYNLTLKEMMEVDSTIQTGIKATDGDVTPGYNVIYYSIVDGPYKDYFLIKNPLTPELTLLKKLDYETLPTFSIFIMAMDQPDNKSVSFNATCKLIITVEDQDDQYPAFSSSFYQGLITNTTAVGSVVPIHPPIYAYDPDVTLNAGVIYSFHDTAGQNNKVFKIDPSTGQVKMVNVSTPGTTYLLVQATQVDNPSRYGVALLAINIQGSDRNAPQFTHSSYQMVIPEVFPVQEVVIAVLAMDKDSNSKVTYKLQDPSNTFGIINDTGEIFLTKALSYVLRDKYAMTVTASDGSLESSANVTIIIRPVHNSPPQILNMPLNVTVARRQGEVITNVDAKTSDETAVLVYNLLSYNDLFSIDEEGIINITADPGSLLLNTYAITVVVHNSLQPSSEKAAVVYVNFPPIAAVVSAQTSEVNNVAVIILAVVAACLLIVVIVLAVHIYRRRVQDEEHFDRVKKPHASCDPKALTFKQNHITLGHQAKANLEFQDQISDTGTAVQENPLNCGTKGSYYNFCMINNSDPDLEAEIQNTQVPFELHHSDSNNNDNIYKSSLSDADSESFSPTSKNALTPFYRNGSVSTYRQSNSSDENFTFIRSATSNSSNTHMPGQLAKNRTSERIRDRTDNSLTPIPNLPNQDKPSGLTPAYQKQELTVYF